MAMRTFRRDRLTRPIFNWARGQLPTLSETERDAVDAGEVWWDADLFSGNPDWNKLLATAPAALTGKEQEFLDRPCEELCTMLHDWEITRAGDLPEDVWKFMKSNRFFGMIIPEEYGGLGFSSFAHSEVVRRISTASITAGVTVMVPNSLGPGELLLQFGTDEQKDHWLPRLAKGEEVPAFALTSEHAGSDASAMRDTGVVCEQDGVVGLRLNWSKRYITLGPVSTVLGLAFKLQDPDGLLGRQGAEGITCALVPTGLPGVSIGRRHIPCGQVFQNGPTTGEDVFIPLDNIIGGPDYAGKGWIMLMSALAAGRGISLPSLSSAAASMAAHTTGAYSRIREQFGIPIGKFEGVQRRLGRLAANAYLLDAARKLTCAGLDEGRKLAVISSIMKSNATYRMREAIDDAMDVHGGKTVIDGPNNYLGNFHKSVPVGITVEGANILTRNMIIFGQGAIRCHPHLLDEILALDKDDEDEALDAFDKAFWAHAGHAVKTFFRAAGRAWTGSMYAPAPDAGRATWIYRRLSRYAAAFALISDFALLTLGGSLKRKEMLSARLGDVLSELYLMSAVLKRWHDEGSTAADFPLVEWAAETSFATIASSLDQVLVNLPNRPAALFLRMVTLPGGAHRGPSDDLTRECAELLLTPSSTRDRLTAGVHAVGGEGALRKLEDAFAMVVEVEPLRRKLREARLTADEALRKGVLTAAEEQKLRQAEALIDKVIAVDDFDPSEIVRKRPDREHRDAAE
ncbi:acyl-CoA dehydrogenase [Roseibium salinum]|uniref:Acyl-coenzyme A dehydrogenase n=1 Tax=Roseibium salinum TaxID=1604349 RepID=A0ABT3R4C2_9HYPH|nr:acyl-CoA dehydrogenase [Roseibium sp. DSM 29163]MCX2723970.1 acyl-CoA dehydrogenase [Roseibium sp. DSM 29163]